jgi:Replication-relaxation
MLHSTPHIQPVLPGVQQVLPQFAGMDFPRTQRDRDMIRALYVYRVLTARQFEALFWYPDKIGILAQEREVNGRCQLRLRMMTGDKCAYRVSIHLSTNGQLSYAYLLWENGERFLVEYDRLDKIDWTRWRKDISSFALWHSIQVNDVRIATELSARRNGFTLADWTDEATIKHTHVRMVVPDGHFTLTAGGTRHFQCIEVDRATETVMYKNPEGRDWRRKINQYQTFFREGIYQKRYNAPNGSCRVLTVTTGEGRLNNLKRVTEQLGGKSRYWFTTMSRALTEDITTAPIWQKAGSDGLYSLT